MFYVYPTLFYCIYHHYLDVQYIMHSRQLQVQGNAVAAASHKVSDASVFPGVGLRKERNPRELHPQSQHIRFGAPTPHGTTGGQMYILGLFSSEVKTLSCHPL